MDWTAINRLHDQMLAAVRDQNGRAWKESAGELHSQYNEMPFWILIYEDSDLAEAHRTFAAIVAPCLGGIAPVQCTVSYTLLKDGREFQAAYLDNNEEILAAAETGLATDLVEMTPPLAPFEATDSVRQG